MLRVGAIALVFVLSVVMAASAQEPPAPTPPAQLSPPAGFALTRTPDLGDGLQPGPYSLIFLMDNPDVLKELKLTDEQKAKLKGLKKEHQEAREKVLAETREKVAKAIAEKKEISTANLARNAAILDLVEAAEGTLARKVLDRGQMTRLREIRLQAEGPSAFNRPEVREKLALFPEQIEEIQKLVGWGHGLVRTASMLSPEIKRTRLDGEETSEVRTYAISLKTIQFRVADARLTSMKAIEALLTNDQRKAFLKLIGAPFQFLKLSDGPPYRVLGQDRGKVTIIDPSGKVEWEAPLPRHTAHDIQLLPNGNILVTTDNATIVEMSPEKKVVWKHVSKPKEPYKGAVEIHAFRRLPDGLTMVAETGNKRIIEVDADDKIVREIPLVVDKPNSHRDTRRARKLDNGHYLVCHELDATVREYDEKGKVVWSYKLDLAGRPATPGHEGHGTEVFNAIRRPDGNTIIAGGNNNRVFEVDPAGKTVWSIEHDELPGIELHWVTSLQLKPNGNLIFGNTHAGPKNPQLIEVTRDKKVVWTLQDFKTFGNDLCAAQVINIEEGVVR